MLEDAENANGSIGQSLPSGNLESCYENGTILVNTEIQLALLLFTINISNVFHEASISVLS